MDDISLRCSTTGITVLIDTRNETRSSVADNATESSMLGTSIDLSPCFFLRSRSSFSLWNRHPRPSTAAALVRPLRRVLVILTVLEAAARGHRL